jgi:hypothetical protein
VTSAQSSRIYRLLRPVFATGLALLLILYFVPCYEPSGGILNAWTTTGGGVRRLSSFDLCLLLVRTGNVQWGTFYIACSGAELILLLLVLLRPRRWVFIVGSCEQLYFLIAFLLRSRPDDLSQPFFWPLLWYAVWAMSLTGFFVKPPRAILAGAFAVGSHEIYEKPAG